jgi:predicted transcriptional regulator
MKTATLPATRVAPALRARVESLLNEGETVSSFIEAAVTEHAEARSAQREFLKRGLAAEQAGDWVTPPEVFKAVRRASAAGRAKRKVRR